MPVTVQWGLVLFLGNPSFTNHPNLLLGALVFMCFSNWNVVASMWLAPIRDSSHWEILIPWPAQSCGSPNSIPALPAIASRFPHWACSEQTMAVDLELSSWTKPWEVLTFFKFNTEHISPRNTILLTKMTCILWSKVFNATINESSVTTNHNQRSESR